MNCSNNALTFSSLNFPEYNFLRNCVYTPQAVTDGGTAACGSVIDLSAEFEKNGKKTTYTWYESNEEIVFDGEGGRFTVPDSFAGVDLICRMTNDTFPKMVLRYKISIEEKTK